MWTNCKQTQRFHEFFGCLTCLVSTEIKFRNCNSKTIFISWNQCYMWTNYKQIQHFHEFFYHFTCLVSNPIFFWVLDKAILLSLLDLGILNYSKSFEKFSKIQNSLLLSVISQPHVLNCFENWHRNQNKLFTNSRA